MNDLFDEDEPKPISTVLGPPRPGWHNDKQLLARSTPLPEWTYETAMAAEDPEFQTPQMATMYRLLRAERAESDRLRRELGRVAGDDLPDVVSALTQKQAL